MLDGQSTVKDVVVVVVVAVLFVIVVVVVYLSGKWRHVIHL